MVHVLAPLIALSHRLGENNGLFDEESNRTQEVSIFYAIKKFYSTIFNSVSNNNMLQVVADILSTILDERNAATFEAIAKV